MPTVGLIPLSSSSLPFKPLLFLAIFSLPICFGGGVCPASFPMPLSPPGLFSFSPTTTTSSYLSASFLYERHCGHQPVCHLLRCFWLLILSLISKKQSPGLFLCMHEGVSSAVLSTTTGARSSWAPPAPGQSWATAPLLFGTWTAHSSRQEQLKVWRPCSCCQILFRYSNANLADKIDRWEIDQMHRCGDCLLPVHMLLLVMDWWLPPGRRF